MTARAKVLFMVDHTVMERAATVVVVFDVAVC